MFALSKVATCAAVGTFVVIGGSLPARAGDPIQHLGPVGPDEAITTTFGSKGVIAFYEPDGATPSRPTMISGRLSLGLGQ